MARCDACGKPGVPFGTICAECEARRDETHRARPVVVEEETGELTPHEEHPVGSFLNVPDDPAYITSHVDRWGQRR